jgi:hypothetical protein
MPILIDHTKLPQLKDNNLSHAALGLLVRMLVLASSWSTTGKSAWLPASPHGNPLPIPTPDGPLHELSNSGLVTWCQTGWVIQAPWARWVDQPHSDTEKQLSLSGCVVDTLETQGIKGIGGRGLEISSSGYSSYVLTTTSGSGEDNDQPDTGIEAARTLQSTTLNSKSSESSLKIHSDSTSQPSQAVPSAVEKLWLYWGKRMGAKRASLNKDREALLSKAIATHGLADCMLAIDGCTTSEWHMGANPSGKKYNSVELIFRSSEKVDQFIGYLDAPTQPASVKHTMPQEFTEEYYLRGMEAVTSHGK